MIKHFPSSSSSVATMDSSGTVPPTIGSGSLDSSTTRTQRNTLLNKFLSKTYHMVDNCDECIACWSNDGNAFTILDQDRFQAEVLPLYFNHGKFTSFIRQLNFYGFVKLRSESDLQTHTQAVRFANEYFVKGRPDLLHKITRSTAQKQSADVNESQLKAMQQQIKMLERKVESLEHTMDQKIRQTTVSLTAGYMSRISALESSYERLLQCITGSLPPMAPTLSSTNAAAPAGATSRNGSVAWHTHTVSPLIGQLDANMISTFLRSKQNQSSSN